MTNKKQTETERKRELDYILEFTKTANFADNYATEQLQCLWTAYCLHSDYKQNAQIHDYDLDTDKIWDVIIENPSCPWHDLHGESAWEQFYCYISEKLESLGYL